ncbi:TonB-dependent receptor domain-containing protein [Phenylobacterium sp.]|uniref:TonB-dependent receptor domain-containing protein n=1 Tax=Phenylobacterium sp. TaxID=1871053 RepID=UPI0035B486CB
MPVRVPFRAALLATAAVLACASAAAGQTAAEANAVEEVVVTASTREQTVAQAPASISIVTAKTLARRPVADLTDALRDVEGISISGGSNTQDVFIRGLPGSYTLILVDGRRQTTRDTRVNGNAGLEQSFTPPAGAIERIEVVRGPMSSLYGSDAIGGVINIITKKVPERFGGSVGVDYIGQEHGRAGDWRQGQFYVAGPLVSEQLGVQLWGRKYDRQEDKILNGVNAADDYNLTGRLAWLPADGHEVLLQADRTYVRRDSTAGHNLAAAGRDSYNTSVRNSGSLSWNGRWDWGTSALSVLREQTQRKAYQRGVGNTDYVRDVRAPEITNTVADALFNLPLADTPLGNHNLVFGGQFIRNELVDINPGRRNNLDGTFKVWQRAAFIEDEWRLVPNFAITGGVRVDDHERYGDHWSPRLYAVWNLNDALTLKGGVSTGFRAPELRQVAPGYAYTTGGGGCSYGPAGTCGVIIGDPNIRPETSTNYEISALYQPTPDISVTATVFRTDFKDKIESAQVFLANGQVARWSDDPNYRLWYWYNLSDAQIQGFEFSTRARVADRLSLKAGYTFTDSEQKSGDYKGYALSRTPKHMANLRGDFQATDALELWAAANYHGEEINAGLRVGANGRPVLEGTRQVARRYPSYTTVDLGGTWRVVDKVAVKFGVYNIGDQVLDVADYDFQGDGRRYWLGVNVDF